MTDKKITIDLDKIQLPTNTPKSYKEYEPYASVLKNKIDDPNVRNIGIVAPYGAGKSSLITTYIEKEKKNDSEFDEKVISISLANYSSIVNEIECEEPSLDTKPTKNGDSAKAKIEVRNEQEIEKSILQQLFYKNNNQNTPASRFKVLKNNTFNNILLTFLITVCSVSIGFLAFQFFDNIFQISPSWKPKWYFIGSAVIIAIATFSLIIYGLIRSKYVKSIQVGDFHFEKNENESISVFNQYLDEIIYFFQRNNFKILIIEDLDRFNNLNIFSKLKELNTLINNNDGIKKKHKKITFVYAVKDSMFKNEEERSKFFEFILPVIPSITPDNVKDELSRELRTILNLEDIPLSSQLVVDISDYISSRRILNNIISDFLIHLSLLHIDNNSDKSLDKLFALMVLKNVSPLEYERLQSQSEKSIIYSILKDKKDQAQSNLCKNLEKEINDLNNYLLELKNEELKSIDELSYLLLGIMHKEHNNFVSLPNPIKTFNGIKTFNYNYRNHYGYGVSTTTQDIKSLEEKFFGEAGYFANRERNITNKSKENHDKLINKKNELTGQRHKILNMTFYEMYELYPEQFPNEIFEENLIKLLLVNGYVDETHMDYLSDHRDDFISYNDKQIKQRINRKEKIDIFERVDSPERLIISLQENRFSSINILNYYIVKELVQNSYSYKEKYARFIECFKRNDNVCKSFIEQIANSNYEYDEVISKLTKEKPQIFEWIYTSTTILQEKKNSVLWSILNNSNITADDISLINKAGVLAEFINYSSDFCNKYNNSNCDIDKLDNILSIELIFIDKFVKNKNSEYILDHNCYNFSIENVNTILSDYYGMRKESIETKNYEVVCELPECSLKTRIFHDINGYIKNLYNKIESGNLSTEKLTDLLINKDIDLEVKKLIVSKETATIFYVEELENEIVEQLISKERIILVTTDVLNLFDKIEEGLIVYYIENHANVLEINQDVLNENETFKLFFFNNTDISKYLDKIGDSYENISEFSNVNNILLLIENRKILYSTDDFCKFCGNVKILKEYCKIFDKEILNDITLQNIEFAQTHIAILYRISKELKLSFLPEIIKLIEKEAISEILNVENPNEFYIAAKNPSQLTKECKAVLLKSKLGIEYKEDLLCNMKEFDDVTWSNLMGEAIGFRSSKNKYAPKGNKFYQELKRRRIKCQKYGTTIVFDKEI